MGIDKKFVHGQAIRFRACKFYSIDHEDEYLAEVERVLCRCSSDVMVMAIVNEWVDEHEERPTAAELLGLVRAHLNADAGKEYVEPLGPRPEISPEFQREHEAFVAEMNAKFAAKKVKDKQVFAVSRERICVRLRDTAENGAEGAD